MAHSSVWHSGPIGPFSVAMHGSAGGASSEELRWGSGFDALRYSGWSGVRGSAASAGVAAAACAAAPDVGRGGGRGGGGAEPGAEGIGSEGGQLLLLATVAFLGGAGGRVAHKKQLTSRFARFFRAGIA